MTESSLTLERVIELLGCGDYSEYSFDELLAEYDGLKFPPQDPSCKSLPSLWQLNDQVSLTFPGNGLLKRGKVIKVAFTAHTEPLYDVDVPFEFYEGDYDPDSPDIQRTGHVRIHGLKEWHLRNPESPVADRAPLPKMK